MPSPVAVGAGVIGGTAAAGATSVAAYHAFNKNGTAEENPTLKKPPASETSQTQDAQQEDTQSQGGTNSSTPTAEEKAATGDNAETEVVSPQMPNEAGTEGSTSKILEAADRVGKSQEGTTLAETGSSPTVKTEPSNPLSKGH
ncbi:hypothetical protein [Candidatus Mycoplasma haematohominis]|uniref:Uncharacterized protein n=1 Tax=Candidatus Mycoplasma haematohominis TaxID=1494318 RepID=A0A478FST2_9MOLU|nr:hypothetical protein [Candidatus Mycoplasma haemohominis]GCE63060.1 hypothetical protein MHSWG343_00380 [Candidatus Mycoplasma haemohominis]